MLWYLTHVIDARRSCCALFVRGCLPGHFLELGLPIEVMSDDEFDNIPDDFADVQDIDWTHLLAGTQHVGSARSERRPELQIQSTLPHANSLDSSTSYFSDGDEMDASFLAELDRIEQRITEAPIVAPSHLQVSGKLVRSPT